MKKIIKCHYCEKTLNELPFKCKHCGQYFCKDHYLPENHNCQFFKPKTWKESLKDVTIPNHIKKRRLILEKERKERIEKSHFDYSLLWNILSKILILVGIIIIIFVFIKGIDWAYSFSIQDNQFWYYFRFLLIVAICHEMMHAIAFWSFGCFAIPIPIMIPPILGITIGEAPDSLFGNIAVSIAPILLTVGSYVISNTTGNPLYFQWGLLNLVGMIYDFYSIFQRS